LRKIIGGDKKHVTHRSVHGEKGVGRGKIGKERPIDDIGYNKFTNRISLHETGRKKCPLGGRIFMN